MISQQLFQSPFGGLWTDRKDALDLLAQRQKQGDIRDEESARLNEFIERGYTVLPGAVSEDVVDAILAELQEEPEDKEKFFVTRSARTQYAKFRPGEERARNARVIDFHAQSDRAREALFAPAICDFLRLVFERDILAFQSLQFNYGSEQAMHQDPAYVVVSKPLQIAASWIALEDIREGTGELIYYRGSHRFQDFKFSGEHKSFNPARDGKEQHQRFLKHLHEEAERIGAPRESFLAKKGDVLIWAADLAHGGSKVEERTADRTRLSLVTHYCPVDVTPNYFNFSSHAWRREWREGCYISSRHFDVATGRCLFDVEGHQEKAAKEKDAEKKKGIDATATMDASRSEFEKATKKVYSLHDGSTLQSRPKTELATLERGYELKALSKDPGIILPPMDVDPERPLLVFARLEAPQETNAQVFFKSDQAKAFTEPMSVRCPLKEGENEVYVAFDSIAPRMALRLDPGSVEGAYRIQDLEVRQP